MVPDYNHSYRGYNQDLKIADHHQIKYFWPSGQKLMIIFVIAKVLGLIFFVATKMLVRNYFHLWSVI